MKPAARFIVTLAILSSTCFGQVQQVSSKPQAAQLLSFLNDSPWGKTQTETDTSEMFFSPTRPGSGMPGGAQADPRAVREQQARNNERTGRGALNQAISVNYRVRFFSARPIREAFAKLFVLNNPNASAELVDDWKGFIERDFGPFIVITVNYDSEDGRLLGPAIQAFASSTKDTLKNNTYLERNDGKRVFLIDYRPPSSDGVGAKFVFPRLVESGPFLSTTNTFVRFVSDLPGNIKLNVKYDLRNMIFNDRLMY